MGSGVDSQLIRVNVAARRVLVAASLAGGLLFAGTTVVAAAQSALVPAHGQPAEQAAPSVPVPSHGQTTKTNAPMARVPGALNTTLGVAPGYEHLLSGLGQNLHDSAARFAAVSSTNWAGLAETGATYTGVSASWVVPTVHAGSSSVSSSWIGIDGFSNSDLIQTGTEQDTSGSGTSYYAWWEILPLSEQPISAITVSPGDQMSASILQISPGNSSTPGTWTISISDQTSGQHFAQSFSYGGSDGQPATSAEWIEEKTGVTPTQPPLANFGTANFTNLSFTTPSPALNTPTLIRMERSLSDHTTIAYPTIPGASALTVTYGQPSTTTAVTASPGLSDVGYFGDLLGNGDGWNQRCVGQVLDRVDVAVYRNVVKRQWFVQLHRRPSRLRPRFRNLFRRLG